MKDILMDAKNFKTDNWEADGEFGKLKFEGFPEYIVGSKHFSSCRFSVVIYGHDIFLALLEDNLEEFKSLLKSRYADLSAPANCDVIFFEWQDNDDEESAEGFINEKFKSASDISDYIYGDLSLESCEKTCCFDSILDFADFFNADKCKAYMKENSVFSLDYLAPEIRID